jgi:hypothetical protein
MRKYFLIKPEVVRRNFGKGANYLDPSRQWTQKKRLFFPPKKKCRFLFIDPNNVCRLKRLRKIVLLKYVFQCYNLTYRPRKFL